MINTILSDLLANGKSETVEFKKSNSLLREGIETVTPDFTPPLKKLSYKAKVVFW